MAVKSWLVFSALVVFALLGIIVNDVDLGLLYNKIPRFRIETETFSTSTPSRVIEFNSGTQRPKTIYTKSPNADALAPVWAYFDPRFNRISLMVLSISVTNSTAYCHYFDENKQPLLPPFRIEVFPDYIANCQPNRYAPFVYLTAKPDLEDGVQDKLLPVASIPAGPAKEDLAICLAPIFGDYDHWLLLLQFVEAHRLLGANKFYFYFLESKDNATLSVLDYYEREGIGEVVLLPNISRCAQVHRCRHNFQIQDCIYRTMHRYKYTAVIDIDEILTPISHETLPQLIDSVNRASFGAFKFRCRWIVRSDPDPPGLNLQLPTEELMALIDTFLPLVKYHYTTAPAPPGHTSKCIVKPEAILHMGVHYVRIMLEDMRTYALTPKEGFVRHYREKWSWPERYREEVNFFGTSHNTSMPFELETRIVNAVKCTLARMKGIGDSTTCD